MVPTCSAGWVVVVLSYGTTTYPRVGGVRIHMLCMYIHRVLRTHPCALLKTWLCAHMSTMLKTWSCAPVHICKTLNHVHPLPSSVYTIYRLLLYIFQSPFSAPVSGVLYLQAMITVLLGSYPAYRQAPAQILPALPSRY